VLHQIETPDAVIQIRPRRLQGHAGPLPEATKTKEWPHVWPYGPYGTGASQEKAKGAFDVRLPETEQTKRANHGPPEGFAEPKADEPRMSNRSDTIGVMPSEFDSWVGRASDQGRRLDQLERKLDQVLKELGRVPSREEKQPRTTPDDQSPPGKK
jgi:hypothetical protein